MIKDIFSGYLPRTESELTTLWDSCIFAFDASVLLNLYCYSNATREDLIHSWRSLRERIWLPHQAAKEFFKNRLRVIRGQAAVYSGLENEIQKAKGLIHNAISPYGEHPMLDRSEIEKLSTSALDLLSAYVSQTKKNHPNYDNFDPILGSIVEFFETRVGKPYDSAKLGAIFSEGKQRYQQKIPPGFMDENKDSDRERYGDLIIWKQLIDEANQKDRPIVFVTDDLKEDWWWRERETNSPNPELVEEFYSLTGKVFYTYTASRLMRHVKTRNVSTIRDASIEEARQLPTAPWRNPLGFEADRLASAMERLEVIFELRRIVDGLRDASAEMVPAMVGLESIDAGNVIDVRRYNLLHDRFRTLMDVRSEAENWLRHIEQHPDVWDGTFSDRWKGDLRRLALPLINPDYSIPHPLLHLPERRAP